MSGCPGDGVMARFTEGFLSEAEAGELRAHVDGCPACLRLLAALGEADGRAGPDAAERIDEYVLLRPLGQGAMGQVYLAQDTHLDRTVAIKLIAADVPDAAARGRFQTEARAIARLTHPNVVGIYRVGEWEGRPYLVSEHVRGQPLDRLPRPVATDRLLRIGRDLAAGLAAAHRHGVLHRDIKPANAILADDGPVKLLDFGLAKLLGPEVPSVPSPPLPTPELAGASEPAEVAMTTQASTLLGTPAYLAPERWRGAPATVQADLYALGAVLYELGSGHPPHRAASLAELGRAVVERDATPLAAAAPGLDGRLAAVVDRCLRRDPRRRPQSADELLQAFAALGPAAGRGAWWWAAGLAAGLALAVAAAVVVRPLRGPARPARLVEVSPEVRAQVGAPLAIPAEQEQLLSAMDRFVREGPDTPERLAVLFRQANLLYGYHHYREAAPLFRELAEGHPASEPAVPAAGLLLDCLHLLGERDALAQQARRFLAMPELLRDPELRATLTAIQRRAGR